LEAASAAQAEELILRRMKASNSGTVKAMSPWAGLCAMPLAISAARVGATALTLRGHF